MGHHRRNADLQHERIAAGGVSVCVRRGDRKDEHGSRRRKTAGDVGNHGADHGDLPRRFVADPAARGQGQAYLRRLLSPKPGAETIRALSLSNYGLTEKDSCDIVNFLFDTDPFFPL